MEAGAVNGVAEELAGGAGLICWRARERELLGLRVDCWDFEAARLVGLRGSLVGSGIQSGGVVGCTALSRK